jgi:ribosome-associated protein
MEKNINEMNENENLAPLTDATSAELAAYIAEVLDSKKAHDIDVIEVGKKTIIAEQFVLCTGGSNTQVRALTDEVEYRTKLRGVEPIRIEGRESNAWIIMDYGHVLVHIFSREARQFYKLEKLYEGE